MLNVYVVVHLEPRAHTYFRLILHYFYLCVLSLFTFVEKVLTSFTH